MLNEEKGKLESVIREQGYVLGKSDTGDITMVIASLPIEIVSPQIDLHQDKLGASISLIGSLQSDVLIRVLRDRYKIMGPGMEKDTSWYMVKTEKIVFNGHKILFVGDSGNFGIIEEYHPTTILLKKTGQSLEVLTNLDGIQISVSGRSFGNGK